MRSAGLGIKGDCKMLPSMFIVHWYVWSRLVRSGAHVDSRFPSGEGQGNGQAALSSVCFKSR